MNNATLRPELYLAEDWMFLVLIAILALWAYTKALYPVRFARLWKMVFNIRLMRQVMREEPNTPWTNIAFTLAFYAELSLLISLFLKFYHIPVLGLNTGLLFLLLIAVIIVVFILKKAVVHTTRFLGQGDFGLSEYDYSTSLINRFTGLLIFPFVIGSLVSPQSAAIWPVLGGLTVFLMAIVFRISKGTLGALRSGVPSFYIFFYICTLEILPVLVCYKALAIK